MAHQIERHELELALQAGSVVAAANLLNIPVPTLRTMCYRLGVSCNGQQVIPDRAMRFKAGDYRNQCATAMCSGFPLHIGICFQCYATQQRIEVFS